MELKTRRQPGLVARMALEGGRQRRARLPLGQVGDHHIGLRAAEPNSHTSHTPAPADASTAR